MWYTVAALVSVVVYFPLPSLAQPCPKVCDPETCPAWIPSEVEGVRMPSLPSPLCSSGTTVLDGCGCCRVCQSHINGTCGGVSHEYGMCPDGSHCVYESIEEAMGITMQRLHIARKEGICRGVSTDCDLGIVSFGCNIDPTDGGCVCKKVVACNILPFHYKTEEECLDDYKTFKEMWSTECMHVQCGSVEQPSCAEDSYLVFQSPQPPDCCQKPAQCVCDEQECLKKVPKCGLNEFLVKTKKGNGEPGNCCNEYRCRHPVPACDVIQCPRINIVQCPVDSFRTPSAVLEGSCCAIPESCRCLPGICPPAHCPAGSTLNVIQKGNGSPGRCCDQVECIKDDGDSMTSYDDSMGSYDDVPLNDSITIHLSEQQEKNTKRNLKGKHIVHKTPQGVCLFDGAIYQEGEKWFPNCATECLCESGLTKCRKMMCPHPPEACTWTEVPEGECCPTCRGCITGENERVNMSSTWERDACTTCSCEQGGEVICQTQLCKVDCENAINIPGLCCPHCKEPTLITQPPLCGGLETCGLRCELGLQRDTEGCFICQCHQADDELHVQGVHCPPLTPETCTKKCAHGYLRDERSCAVCKCARCPPLDDCLKHCLYGFDTNAVACSVCKCKERASDRHVAVSTSPLLQTTPAPSLVTSHSDNPCFDLATGHSRDSGEWWYDGCRHCYCEEGHEYCSLIACPAVDCEPKDYVFSAGTQLFASQPQSCCPTCRINPQQDADNNVVSPVPAPLSGSESHSHTVCHAPGSGRLFVDGETWNMTSCVLCTCRIGHVLCHVQRCPPLVCDNPTPPLAGQCCSTCPGKDTSENRWWLQFDGNLSNNVTICTDEDGVAHIQGAVWRKDDCTSCVCTKKGINCYQEPCAYDSSLQCRTHRVRVKGQCCPLCTDTLSRGSCHYKEDFYSAGEQWRDGSCRNCSCEIGGQTLCTQLQCSPCKVSLNVVGRCCPICQDAEPDLFEPNSTAPPATDSTPYVEETHRTIHPNDVNFIAGHNYNETQQLNLIAIFTCLGLVLVVVLVLIAACWLWRRKTGTTSHHRGFLAGKSVSALVGGASGSLSQRGSFANGKISKNKSDLAQPAFMGDQQMTESLLSASSNGTTVSSAGGGGGGEPEDPLFTPLSTETIGESPHIAAPIIVTCERASSFDMKKLNQLNTRENNKRPLSCKV